MRHRKSGRHLGRMSAHRHLMFKNMIASLFEHEAIQTTVPKAKELRRFAEPLITLAKIDSVANRRLAFARIHDREMVTKLFTDLGPRFKTRPGGYLRVLKCGVRQNDCAPMAFVELVDRKTKEVLKEEKQEVKKKAKTTKAKTKTSEKKVAKPAKKTVKKEVKTES